MDIMLGIGSGMLPSIFAVNPYSGLDALEFLLLWAQRMFLFLTGGLAPGQLASDEIQVLVLVSVSVSAALVGTFLVLKRMAMLANSLSHTILFGIVIAFLLTSSAGKEGNLSPHLNLNAMVVASLLTGLLTTFLTEFLCKRMRLQEDASNGLVFTTLFALGVVLATIYTRNSHIGTEVIMGNADALGLADLGLTAGIMGVNIILILILFKEYRIVTFDTQYAKAMGISPAIFSYLLMTQVSGTAVGAFRAVGVLMVLSLIVTPPLTARLLTDRLGRMLLLASGIGALSACVGVVLSRHLLTVYGLALSTAGLVVCVTVVFYVMALLFAPERGLVVKFVQRRRLRKA